MAYREVSRVEIAEVVRRWQSGMSQRQIATGTGLSRATVRRYIDAAVEAGLARDGPAPSEEQLTRLAGLSVAGPRKVEIPTEEVLAPWADQVYEWLTADRLQVTRIHELLADRGCRVSYTSLRRFIVRRGWQRRSPATVRMGESAPGEVAEMDFGRLGLMQDPETGRRRVVWALIIVLSYSRHSFVWPTFSQKLVDVIEGLEAAWAFFEGVPKYLVIDNFPAAVAGVDPLHPRLTRGFLEYSQHRGFILDPARVRHPRDKPRVERGVPYVRERFFKGGEFTPGPRRQIHRPRRLPGRAERLHPQSAGANQAQRGVTGTGRGSLCRASLRRPAALGQAQAGTQAHTPGRTLLP